LEKRKLIIGTYDTALTGQWTLSAWTFAAPTLIESYIDVPGRIDGPLDASTALTDGDPRYGPRPLEAILESSEGTRLEREARINAMVNLLDGQRVNIVLPDDPTHHIRGRVRVSKEYNDPSHCAVTVTATCEPWRYQNHDTVVGLTATTTEQIVAIINTGRRAVVPVITVTGEQVRLGFGTSTWTVSAGTYQFPELVLKTGSHPLTYSGTGTILITYREAVL
jgi:hypothetical protein